MNRSARKSIFPLLLCAALLGCGGVSLSIFEWKVSYKNPEWQTFVSGNEIYLITSTTEDVDGDTRWIATLDQYNGKEKIWSSSILPNELTSIADVQLIETNPTDRLIHVFGNSTTGLESVSFDVTGSQIYRAPMAGTFVAAGINEQTLGAITNRDGAYFLSTWSNNGWVDITTLTIGSTEPKLESLNAHWIVTDTDNRQILSIDQQGAARWEFTWDEGQYLTSIVVGTNSIVAVKRIDGSSENELLYIEGETGDHRSMVYYNADKILTLDATDQAYLSTGTANTRHITHVDHLGNTLWQSNQTYDRSNLGAAQLSPNGELAVIHYTEQFIGTDSHGSITEYTSLIDIVGQQGLLKRQYAALPYQFSRFENCVEYCTVWSVKDGYHISKLFIDEDEEFYVRGVMPRITLGYFANPTYFFAKIDAKDTVN